MPQWFLQSPSAGKKGERKEGHRALLGRETQREREAGRRLNTAKSIPSKLLLGTLRANIPVEAENYRACLK